MSEEKLQWYFQQGYNAGLKELERVLEQLSSGSMNIENAWEHLRDSKNTSVEYRKN